MKNSLFSSIRNLAFPRCSHRSPSGRQCSQPVCSSHPHFCFVHIPKPDPEPAADQLLAAELATAAANLDSPTDVLRVLSKVFLAVTQDRISLRKGRLLNSLGHTLLRAHREIAFHKKSDSDSIPEFFDIPRPDRSDDPEPEPQHNLPSPVTPSTPPAPARPLQPQAASPEPPTLLNKSSANIPALTNVPQPAPTPSSIPSFPEQNETPCSLRMTNSFSITPVPVAKYCKLREIPLYPPPRPAVPPKPIPNPDPPPPLPDLHYFYPYDPSLPPGTQDPWSSVPPHRRPGYRGKQNRRPNRGRFQAPGPQW